MKRKTRIIAIITAIVLLIIIPASLWGYNRYVIQKRDINKDINALKYTTYRFLYQSDMHVKINNKNIKVYKEVIYWKYPDGKEEYTHPEYDFNGWPYTEIGNVVNADKIYLIFTRKIPDRIEIQCSKGLDYVISEKSYIEVPKEKGLYYAIVHASWDDLGYIQYLFRFKVE